MSTPRKLQDSGAIAPTHAAEGGFRATLSDAGLWDLVQMKCEARARCVVRVSTPASSGELYFADGQIVHATCGRLIGEAAALQMLSWRTGSWDPCERVWPPRNTINTTWQALLLRAAQLQDEAGRSERVSVVRPRLPAPPARSSLQPPRIASSPAPVAQERVSARASEAPPERESSVSYRPDDFEHAVRLDAQGSVLTGHGNAEDLSALAAYVCRLGDLVGELLGMDALVAFEGHATDGRCLIFRDQTGDTVALRPRADVDLTRLKARLRL